MVTPVYFDDAYREPATLRDGTQVVLRLLQPDDKAALARGFARMSPESRYRRFFAAKSELSADELRYLTELDQRHHLAIAATTADGLEGLGVARYIELAEKPGLAEAAIAVVDEAQGKGLGSLLFQRLVAAARERDVREFRCDMLGSNQGMADLVRTLSPDASIEIEQGVMRMEFTLPGLEPQHPAGAPPRETGLYRLMVMIAEGAVMWRARWQQLGERWWLGGRADVGDESESGEAPSGGRPIATAAAAIDDPELDEPG